MAAGLPIWRKMPFLRILIALIAGIIIQWQVQVPLNFLWGALIFSGLLLLSLFFLPFFERYKLSFLGGTAISLLFMTTGALLTWFNDIRHDKHWIGNYYSYSNKVIATIQEPLIEKTKSYKADASVNFLIQNEKTQKVKGKIILYFKKDSILNDLEYGTQILISKPLQEIKNSGNPGGFDYKRYCLFNEISYQAYLQPQDFIVLPGKNEKWLEVFLIRTRERVINILRSNIKGNKELGLAEALLIGYKNDLDKNLVQSYTNTGVVHIIAISGLHLGLIYWLLVQLLKPFKKQRQLKWLRPVLIICGLWLFALLAGAQPSILRAAVMFTCIVVGENFYKKGNIYNTLSFSAFLMLCWNPFWLWDVGFQLSYAAVLSIVIFMRPIYNLFYIKNKALDFIWKLNAVTLAAQILTLPLSVYHFHQFPGLFFLTNFVAVPLSSIILIGEIILCAVSFIPVISLLLGNALSWLIWLMNSYIERIEAMPYSLWDGFQINIFQAILLVIIAAGFGSLLIEKRSKSLVIGLVAILGFTILRTASFINRNTQQKIIVYNVPQKRAIDFIDGRKYLFVGDPDLLEDDFSRNFHLKPSRILHRIEPAVSVNSLWQKENLFMYANKKIMLIDKETYFSGQPEKHTIDLLVLSKNPKIYISRLSEFFKIHKIVFDGSVPQWKMNYWKKDCDSLQIPYHDVNEKGAFVMSLR